MKKLIKIFLICTLMLLALCVTASAETEGNFTYTVSGEKVTITGFPTDVGGEVIIPSAIGGYPVTAISTNAFKDCALITKVVVPDSVTSIGESAFRGCNTLEEITLPFVGNRTSSSDENSVFGAIFGYTNTNTDNTIRQYSSKYMDGSFERTEYYYYYIPSTLKKVTITKETDIPVNAFYNCSQIKEVCLPDTVTSMGKDAFYNCTSLERVEIKDIQAWYEITFGNEKSNPIYYAKKLFENNEIVTELVIPETIIKVNNYAFYNCEDVEKITIPSSVTSIGAYAFKGCALVTKITVPDNVTSIGEGAFQGCNVLEEITLPFVGNNANSTKVSGVFGYIFGYIGGGNSTAYSGENCVYQYKESSGTTTELYKFYYIPSTLKKVTITKDTNIPLNAFYNCGQLIEINLPDTVITIDDYAFYNCSGISEMNLPEGLSSIGSYAFSECNNLKNVYIPSTVTEIKNYSFNNCSGITKMEMPDSVKSIGSYAFSGCTSIAEIIIANSATYIGEYAFKDCILLTRITVPDSVTSIGEGAFQGCNALEEITLPFVGRRDTVSGENGAVFGYIFGYGSKTSTNCVLQQYSSTSGWNKYYYIPSTLKKVTITKDKGLPYGAFYNCSQLTEINLPDTLTTFGTNAFYNSGVYNDANNWDGKMFYVDKNLISASEVSARYDIRPGTTAIADSAFSGKTALQKIYIPDSVKAIGTSAFSGCTGLNDVLLGSDVEEIKNNAFNNCKSIENASYKGSEADWDEVVIGTNNTYLTDLISFDNIRLRLIDTDGNELINKTVKLRSRLDYSIIPEKSEHTWKIYTDKECTTEFDANTMLMEDTDIYIVYTINKYSYTFLNGDGTILKTETIPYGSTIEIPAEEPVKAKDAQYTYMFIDWEGYTRGMTITSNITFTPNFENVTNRYTYKYVDESGNVLKTITADYGTVIVPPATTPEKQATAQYTYTFAGWEGYTEGMTVSADATFKPIYTSEVRKYTYQFLNEDGSVLLNKTVSYGTKILLPTTTPTKSKTAQYTYTFLKWDGYDADMAVTGDITFKPVFNATVNKYTYTFLNDDGSELKTVTADYGAKIQLPDEEPYKASTAQYTYQFSGWKDYEKGMTVTADVEFIPIFTEVVNKYTYTFLDSNGYAFESKSVEYGTVITAPTGKPTKPSTTKYSYVFTKWEGFVIGMKITGDITFNPVFTPVLNRYTYTFLNGNGSVMKTGTIEYGSVIPVPTQDPVKEKDTVFSYVFDRWNGYTDGMTIAKDITFTPEFTQVINKYTYKFVDEDGKVYANVTEDYGTAIIAPFGTPEKAEDQQYIYTFSGWKDYVPGMTLEKDITFIAEFDKVSKQYTYKFLNCDGSILESNTVDYGSIIELPSSKPVKPSTSTVSYTFTGWKNYVDGMLITKDISFEPQFSETEITYTYKFLNDDGSVMYEATAEYGDVIIAPTEIPEKEGNAEFSYVFAKWNGFSEGMTITKDVSFTPEFMQKKNEYTYRFIGENGETIKEITAQYGELIEVPSENPTKEPDKNGEYVFAGWEGYTEGMILEKNIEFKAKFSLTTKQYTYKFLNEDGSVLYEETVDFGTVISTPVEIPETTDPGMFDYWNGYTEGMVITGDIVFKPVFKYESFNITVVGYDEINATAEFKSMFEITPAEKENYIFLGYYTEEAGEGIQLTDDRGKSLKGYKFDRDIVVYPLFEHAYVNKASVTGFETVKVGDTEVKYSVNFGTKEDIQFVTFGIKYPNEFIEPEIELKDFVEVNLINATNDGEYTEAEYLCIYSYDGMYIPKETLVNPFEIAFNVSKAATPMTKVVELTEKSVMNGESEDYSFISLGKVNVEIQPCVAETISIEGPAEVTGVAKYTAHISPDFVTDKTVLWSVDDVTVATISQDGTLSPIKKGTVVITATAENGEGVKATKIVEITKATATISDLSVNEGIWDKEFNAYIFNYKVIVSEDVDKIELSPQYALGTVKYNGKTILNGRKEEILLSTDETVIVLERGNVTGSDSSIYTITVVRMKEGLYTEVVKEKDKHILKIYTDKENEKINNAYLVVTSNKNKVQKKVVTKKITQETAHYQEITIDDEDTDSYTVMIWESLANLKPVYEPIIKEL